MRLALSDSPIPGCNGWPAGTARPAGLWRGTWVHARCRGLRCDVRIFTNMRALRAKQSPCSAGENFFYGISVSEKRRAATFVDRRPGSRSVRTATWQRAIVLKWTGQSSWTVTVCGGVLCGLPVRLRVYKHRRQQDDKSTRRPLTRLSGQSGFLSLSLSRGSTWASWAASR